MKKNFIILGAVLSVLIISLSGCFSGPPNFSNGTLFYDNFSNGMQGLKLFGTPQPEIVNVHGKSHVFDNMGDGWCLSGAITEKTYDLSNGAVITAEVYLEVDDMNGCWNEIVIGTSNGEYCQSGDCEDDDMQHTNLLFFFMDGYSCWGSPSQYQGHSYIYGYKIAPYSFNADDYTNGWHTLKAVITPSGYEDVYIDNNYVGESESPIPQSDLKNMHIYIGGRSSGDGGKAYVAWIKIANYNGN